MDVSDYIAADPVAAEILERLVELLEDFEAVERTDQKSQIRFARKHPFAALWVPEQYLQRKTVPAVLSLMAKHRMASDRFKQVVEPRPNRFTHHIELDSADDLDADVRELLHAAWQDAG